MKKITKIFTLALSIVMMSFMLCSCTERSGSSIIGKWSLDRDDTIEFFNDGTYFTDAYIMGYNNGNYYINGNNITLRVPAGTHTFQYKISGNTMEWSDDSGTEVLKRVRN